MPTIKSELLGSWKKATQSPCSEKYPQQLEFRENGIYSGRAAARGDHTLWDVGNFELLDPGTLKLSVANDAELQYRISIEADRLNFVDGDGCEFSYRREKSP